MTCFPDGIPNGKRTLGLAQIIRAFNETKFAKPQTHLQPEGNVTLVTLPVYFSVSWPTAGYQPQEVDAVNLLGYAVRIRPTLEHFTYVFGDGTIVRAHRRRRAAATPTATSPAPMTRRGRTRRTSTSPTAASSASTVAPGPGSPTPSPFPARRRPSPCGRRSRVSSVSLTDTGRSLAIPDSPVRQPLGPVDNASDIIRPLPRIALHDDRPGGNVRSPDQQAASTRSPSTRRLAAAAAPGTADRRAAPSHRRLARPSMDAVGAVPRRATCSTPWPSAGAAGRAWCRTPNRRCTPSRRPPEPRPAATPPSRPGSPPPGRCADHDRDADMTGTLLLPAEVEEGLTRLRTTDSAPAAPRRSRTGDHGPRRRHGERGPGRRHRARAGHLARRGRGRLRRLRVVAAQPAVRGPHRPGPSPAPSAPRRGHRRRTGRRGAGA